MSERANGRAIWSCSTKSRGAAVAATASPCQACACLLGGGAAKFDCLATLEAGRDAHRRNAAGLDDLPLFASLREAEPKRDDLAEALAAIEPDGLSPRDALESLYLLKRVAAMQDSE